ncbi:MAG: type II toxin-antitoxin system RelE family toxin [Alphaproteobacteria bacterium]
MAALPRADQKRITAKVDALAHNPYPPGIKKLSHDEGLFRLRVGQYRVLYQVQQNVLLVLVVKIGHRRDIYRRL